jgi:hypothetical protein
VPLSRRSLIFRRTVLAVTLVYALPLCYWSEFMACGFLYGAGVISAPLTTTLCETVLALIYWADRYSDRMEFLLEEFNQAYWCGFELRG